MEGYMGTILPWAGTYAPRNWAFCAGQTLSISTNTALYSIIGTNYGGDGVTTFQLPNLQSRFMVGHGQGPGLQPYTLGEMGGIDVFHLTTSQMPVHNHLNAVVGQPSAFSVNVAIPSVANSDANVAKPNNTAVMGKSSGTANYSNADPDGNMKPFNATGSVTPLVSITNANAGGSAPIDNCPPYVALNFIICVTGLYPARN